MPATTRKGRAFPKKRAPSVLKDSASFHGVPEESHRAGGNVVYPLPSNAVDSSGNDYNPADYAFAEYGVSTFRS
jgi:hypothetical protein